MNSISQFLTDSLTNFFSHWCIDTMANTGGPANASLDAALENLADISVGHTPSIWPLAWGWWVLILLLLSAIVGIFWIVSRYISKHKFKRRALKAIEKISGNEPQALSTLHAILRSAIIHYFPFDNLTSLQGPVWQELLQVKAKAHKKVDQQCLTHLTQLEASLYTRAPSVTVDDAKNAVYLWITYCLPPSGSALPNAEIVALSNKGDQHV